MKLKLAAAGVLVAALAVAGPAMASSHAKKGETVYQTMLIVGHALGQKGPDGLSHDTTYGSDFTVKKGDHVVVTVWNWDEGPHTITVKGLGLNVKVPGAVDEEEAVPSKTVFRFTATKVGSFRWFCALPCDAKQNYWAMRPDKEGVGQDGFMAGHFHITT